MRYKLGISVLTRMPAILATMIFLSLTGCSESSDDDAVETEAGYIQLYNVSSNSPGIVLTVDKNNDDDYVETKHSSVSFSSASEHLAYEADTYDIDLSWQDGADTDDLESVYENELTISNSVIEFIVVAEDIAALNVLTFDIPVIDEEEDDDYVFNTRFLNMHPGTEGVDIYLSKSDETFHEAIPIGQLNYTEMSDNHQLEVDSYVFYITLAGSDEIVYQSSEVTYQASYQYVMVIRENKGVGTSPYTLDRVANSGVVKEYGDADAEAQFRVYNSVIGHELLPSYQGIFNLRADSIADSVELPSLAFGGFSVSCFTNFGDYSLTLSIPETSETIIDNHLLTLNVDSDKTVFFYLLEEDVDEDGDGDVDEDGDGVVDEVEITVNSLIVNNSHSENIYYHQIKVINLIDHFDKLKVYFVKSDETIDTTDNLITSYYVQPRSTSLLNNAYSVYMVGIEDGSELILAMSELILDENSKDSFLMLEESTDSSSGYKMAFSDQRI